MAWECAECQLGEGTPVPGGAPGVTVEIDVVCHHCGKPLCRNDRFVLVDDAFDASAGEDAPRAAHCKECRQRYHPRVTVLEPLFDGRSR
ncbi:hypothetical protein [Saccharothrix lopnurensis]|uniref:Uncharacterized protein n=1 Tax=Saccharothrix lopnurensis TaxID=1670621 RepID=A0ABW1NZR3_9PSEU